MLEIYSANVVVSYYCPYNCMGIMGTAVSLFTNPGQNFVFSTQKAVNL